MQPRSVPRILLESDSSSALQLLVGQDIPKRSRHVEIRLARMKSKMASGELEIEHRAGTENVADLFTKCLSTRDFLRHRASLGFEAVEVPARDLRSVNDLLLINDVVSNKQEIAFVEVCCGTNSALRDACRVARMPYVGVVKLHWACPVGLCDACCAGWVGGVSCTFVHQLFLAGWYWLVRLEIKGINSLYIWWLDYSTFH